MEKKVLSNPSVGKTSTIRLNARKNGEPLRVLSEEDWNFWSHNGYIVIKNAVPKVRQKDWQIIYGNMKTKILMIRRHGTDRVHR